MSSTTSFEPHRPLLLDRAKGQSTNFNQILVGYYKNPCQHPGHYSLLGENYTISYGKDLLYFRCFVPILVREPPNTSKIPLQDSFRLQVNVIEPECVVNQKNNILTTDSLLRFEISLEKIPFSHFISLRYRTLALASHFAPSIITSHSLFGAPGPKSVGVAPPSR